MSLTPIKFYTKEEVAVHNKPDDCWIVIDNKVIDITEWKHSHPGGESHFNINAGKDITQEFYKLHSQYSKSFDIIDQYTIGEIYRPNNVNNPNSIDNQHDNIKHTTKKLWEVTAERGFLPTSLPISELPSPWHVFDEFVSRIPSLSSSNRFRNYVIQNLHKIPSSEEDLKRLREEPESVLNRIHSLIGFISLSYIHGSQLHKSDNSNMKLPKALAVIWTEVSDLIQRKPMIDYTDLILYNYGTFTTDESLLDQDINQFFIDSSFTGVIDEEWFFKVHLFIEWHARKLVASTLNIYDIISGDYRSNNQNNNNHIQQLIDNLRNCLKFEQKLHEELLPKMYEFCNSFVFFNRIRHYVSSIKDVEYESLGTRSYNGATGAQSSIFNLLDILFGVPNPIGELSTLVKGFSESAPYQHRVTLENLRAKKSIRDFIKEQSNQENVNELVNVYNQCVEELYKIRMYHIKFVDDYIFAHIPKKNTPTPSTTKGSDLGDTNSTELNGGDKNETSQTAGSGGSPVDYLTVRAKQTLEAKLTTITINGSRSSSSLVLSSNRIPQLYNEDKPDETTEDHINLQSEIENEKEIVEDNITPWSTDGRIDYSRIINKFGASYISSDIVSRFEKITGKSAHLFLRRNIFYSHRDIDLLLDQFVEGKKFYLYTGRGPSSGMHLGHLVPLLFTKWLQDVFHVPVVIQLTDDEKYLFSKGRKSLDHIKSCTKDNLLDIIACGFDVNNTFIFSNLEFMGNMYEEVIKIQNSVTANQAKGTFGFTDTDSIGKWMFPAIQAAPSFSNSFPGIFPPNSNYNCLIPQAIDQDAFFRLTRDVASKLNYSKPALIHCRFLPSLEASDSKMKETQINSTITLKDTPEEIEQKIKSRAYSGGGVNLKEHRKHGANLEKDVSIQWLKFFLEDDAELERICFDYQSGSITTMDVKKHLIGVIQKIVGDHQERRKSITDDTIQQFLSIRPLCVSTSNNQ